MTDPKAQSRIILKKLFKNANGDAADAIIKYQGKNLPSFGIMYPEIKALSTQFRKNNTVAAELIKKNTREARIMAMLLVDVEDFDESLVKLFIEQSESEELENHLARHVLTPFLSGKSWHELKPLLGVRLSVKTMIQFFRACNEMPAYEESLRLLKEWIVGQFQPLMDGAHLAEAIYRNYPEQRSHLEQALKHMIIVQPDIKTEVQNWLNDFQYLE